MSAFIIIWTFMTLLGVTAVGGLIWAITSGQFRNLSENARSIFDEHEPEGEINDRFPENS